MGDYTTFVVLDNGDIYSFGAAIWGNVGHDDAAPLDGEEMLDNFVPNPKLATSLKELDERIVQISPRNNYKWYAHTIALTESGKIFAFRTGNKGQLGSKLPSGQKLRANPEQVNIDLIS
ncbi:hypothetical protein CDL15_Pgr009799 [Punica granatum]|uniref:Uncharacterized protein n=1 Tax=Punica granatum TaxID=22663 RepID=A0A218WU10_PUNGR|nr:hypothetical protein CDL15_Pgr009799 [Punica granatum]